MRASHTVGIGVSRTLTAQSMASRTVLQAPSHWSRYGRGLASIRHQSGIHSRNIFYLTSYSSFAGAQLCEPATTQVRARLVTCGGGIKHPHDLQGTSLATDRGTSVGWEAG